MYLSYNIDGNQTRIKNFSRTVRFIRDRSCNFYTMRYNEGILGNNVSISFCIETHEQKHDICKQTYRGQKYEMSRCRRHGNFHCMFENKLILNMQNNISTNNSAIRRSQNMKNKISLQSHKNHTLENNRF